MIKNILLVLLFLLLTHSLFSQNAPLYIWGTGLDGSVLQKTAIYSDRTNGLLIEAPRNGNNENLPISFGWRGGGLTPIHILPNGYVGLGTKTPSEMLTIKGKSAMLGIYDTNVVSKANNRIGRYSNALVIQNDSDDTWQENISFHDNGNVGIGTTNPTEKLHIKGNKSAEIRLESNLGNAYVRQSNGTLNFYNKGERLTILSTGQVGIGTTETGTHKLAVNGTIGAREIKVETDSWSDFVFKEDYQLKDLKEVESFIEENKHLPDIPSEKEVLENGIAVGEMNAKLLQKIEELTLYMIEQNKVIKSQNIKIQKLNARINTIEIKQNSRDTISN
ncbi:hypothetical protein DF185_22795 [Marinifilum breve]|uniref:Peptidase S74 domain-containing protein n=1 Tax=Marinifilum breve TaxID=2184082 RepID=A0A2V3ZQ80_9BACT|nr:hypothetical protein [Marinifilum breve]PXX95009.1 hypothetical protein DF185_22795 [Marinifilum breve]